MDTDVPPICLLVEGAVQTNLTWVLVSKVESWVRLDEANGRGVVSIVAPDVLMLE